MERKLVCVLACRNQGSRLYGKPLQNLDIKKKIRVIDYIISSLKKLRCIDEIVLAISRSKDNDEYKQIANKQKMKFVTGDEIDVLSRLIKGAKIAKASDVYRMTSESPFVFSDKQLINKAWKKHIKYDYDFTNMGDGLIDGCEFEIIKLSALERSHKFGKRKHRSELCTLYIRENKKKFKIQKIKPPKYILRKDLRLTIDYPEDLIICREVFKKRFNNNIKLIIQFLDQNPYLKKITRKIFINEKK